MLIDWFTLSAQVVNFIILVLLLKFLLFKRVLKALDQREDEMADQLDRAHQAKKEADQHEESLRGEIEAFQFARDTRIKALENEIKEIRRSRMQALSTEAEERQLHWQSSLREQQDHFLEKLQSLALRHLGASMRAALNSLADAELEPLLAKAFVKHLRSLPDEEQRAFLEGVPINGDGMVIESKFVFDSKLRDWLAKEIQEVLHYDGEVRFVTRDQPGCGLSLRVAGSMVEWSLDHYFDEMVDELREQLQDELLREPSAAA